MHWYTIFGLLVKSMFFFRGMPEADPAQADDAGASVSMIRGCVPRTLSNARQCYDGVFATQREMLAEIPEAGVFYVRNGCEIIVSQETDAPEEMLHLYLLGLCMGAILHQRGILPVHASCLYADGGSLMIAGDSGAGKSTVTSALLSRGWLLMSDDITPVIPGGEGTIATVSGYPAQKIWESNDYRIPDEKKKFLLYGEEGRQKFAVDESTRFYSGKAQLRLIVYLSAHAQGNPAMPQGALAGIHRLMTHTYQSVFIVDGDAKKRQFQACAEIARVTPSISINRGPQDTPEAIADRIIERWEEWKQ